MAMAKIGVQLQLDPDWHSYLRQRASAVDMSLSAYLRFVIVQAFKVEQRIPDILQPPDRPPVPQLTYNK